MRRLDFDKGSHCAYSSARRHAWLDDICSHMLREGNKLFRCVYVYEFSDNSIYVGLTYSLKKRDSGRKLQKKDAVTKHILETNLLPTIKQLSDYVYVDVAAVLENDCIDYYKLNGYNVLNKAKGGAIGTSLKKWSKENCHKVALKYNKRSEFYRYSNNIYSAACRNGWLDEICSHMVNVFTHWSKENCHKDALKYMTRGEYQIKSHNSYVAANRHCWINEICQHML
jgi:hypothetical protein